MRIVRSLGGYIASAHYQAPSRGVAISTLKLKVPATRSQDALTRISALGEILSQKVSLEDVQRTVTVESDRIKTLQQRIAELERSLSDSSLTAEARSRLQVQLANARANLHSLQVQRSANVRRGRLATITLTLTTGDLPKLATKPSRIHKAIDRAWNGLSSEISWAAMAIIVASPFLLLAAVLAVLVRYRRRREERRLLEK
jgi:septal ring factor EnvC (AmiA/AmiB activator)